MTPDHLAILMDLFLKACGVALLALIAWRWKFDRTPSVQRLYPIPRRHTGERAQRGLHQPIESIPLQAITVDRPRP